MHKIEPTVALPGKERAPQAQAVTGGLTGPDSESPDLSGRGQAQGRAQLLWGGSLRGVAAPARRRAPDLAPGPSTGDLLDEPQCVLPNVDQASQSLHWLLGRGGRRRETGGDKAGEGCVFTETGACPSPAQDFAGDKEQPGEAGWAGASLPTTGG